MEPKLFIGHRVLTEVWRHFDAAPGTHRPEPPIALDGPGVQSVRVVCLPPAGKTVWTVAVTVERVPAPACKLSLFAQHADGGEERERIANALHTNASGLSLLMTDPSGRLFMNKDHPFRSRFRDVAGDPIHALERRVGDLPGFTEFAYAPAVAPIIATALRMITCEDACG